MQQVHKAPRGGRLTGVMRAVTIEIPGLRESLRKKTDQAIQRIVDNPRHPSLLKYTVEIKPAA